ncbi:neuronal acetylcholine receptor subunit alpha-7-like [Ylistrum balloti]|uniref:neuronal acetylcholine receptor subunit alpha-7-like n=1 Tax=Ylistrum balloti TaxID=509963 RepID=UPI002905A067|nr:neuronal acetylcholine receptor subunit alpha-7-like [Ylistrum balloti]
MFRVPYIIFTVICVQTITANSMEDVKTLLADLMVNYSSEVRPVKDQTKPVSIDVGMALVSINDFNEVTGVISVVIVLFLSWADESLVWDSSSYNNTTSLTFSEKKIWVPNIFLTNPANDFKPVSNKHFKVTVQANGSVYWTPGSILQATCQPDVSKFPFDLQECTISIAPHGYYGTQVSLFTNVPTINLDFYSPNSAWDIISTKAFVTTVGVDIASFTIEMSRRPLNFMVSVVIPIIMLALINPFVFILPFNSGERTSCSITVLLAFTVYMTVVSDRMPASSEPMSHLSYYLLSMLALSVFIVTVNIFQIRTYSKNENEVPVPKWMKNLIMNFYKICRKGKVETKSRDPYETKRIPDKIESIKNHIIRLESIDESDLAENKTHSKDENCNETSFSQPENITWYTVAKYADKLYFTAFLVFTGIASLRYFVVVAT